MKYYCSKCELAVIVLADGTLIKACRCDAAVTAEMEAKIDAGADLKG